MGKLHKTTIELDLDALSEAQANLGTRGYKATVDAALREVNRRAALERAAQYVRDGRMHLPDPEQWAAWREPRT